MRYKRHLKTLKDYFAEKKNKAYILCRASLIEKEESNSYFLGLEREKKKTSYIMQLQKSKAIVMFLVTIDIMEFLFSFYNSLIHW